LAQQNLLDSHDTVRLASRILNRKMYGLFRGWDTYPEVSNVQKTPKFSTAAPGPQDKILQKLAAAFQFCYVGAPMIYYGDEAGMWGATDPDCRKPMLWDDIAYDSERMNPDQSPKASADKVAPDKDLFAFYAKLAGLRKTLAPLRLGDYKTMLVDDKKNVFVFSRSFGGNTVFCAFNNSAEKQTVKLPALPVVSREMLGGADVFPANAAIEAVLPPYGAAVIAQQ